MTWLSENPWPLVIALAALAVAFLVALRVTQKGKYLVWSGTALGLAAAVLLVERAWVTDRERIASIILDVADAVEASDYDRIRAHLSPEYAVPGGMITEAIIRGTLGHMEFEFVRITQLETTAGRLTGRGKADFLAQASWEQRTSTGSPDYNATPPPGVGFSVGFVREESGAWKVARIDVVSAPGTASPDSVAGYLARLAR